MIVFRFLLLWSLVAAVVYVLSFVASKKDRKVLAKHTTKIVVSFVVALVFMLFGFLLGNLGGL